MTNVAFIIVANSKLHGQWLSQPPPPGSWVRAAVDPDLFFYHGITLAIQGEGRTTSVTPGLGLPTLFFQLELVTAAPRANPFTGQADPCFLPLQSSESRRPPTPLKAPSPSWHVFLNILFCDSSTPCVRRVMTRAALP